MHNKQLATDKFTGWKNKVLEVNIKEFNSVVNSIEHHFEKIMNFFNNRNTNANAESFNSKLNHYGLQVHRFLKAD